RVSCLPRVLALLYLLVLLRPPRPTRFPYTTLFRSGWFRTGDLGVMHPDGYIALKDRSKDIIISGGENISSVEVEQVLYRHPAVLDRKSTRLNSSHVKTSYAVFCLKKKKASRRQQAD